MSTIIGIDVGSTYTKALILGEGGEIAGRAMTNTSFQLAKAARWAMDLALERAGLEESELDYIVATGFGRHQVPFRDVNVTDLTASARGAAFRRTLPSSSRWRATPSSARG